MGNHFQNPSAVILMLIKQEGARKKILLQQRQNTGFADGLWDLSCSGHVEHGESMTAAVVREAREELGIALDADKIKFFTMIHKREEEGDITYYNGYFFCESFFGEPKICEPAKCAKLKWVYIDELPEELIADRKIAVKAYLNGVNYVEYGW